MSKTSMGVGIILSRLNVKKNSATTLMLKQCVKTVQKHVAIAKVSLECKKYIEFNKLLLVRAMVNCMYFLLPCYNRNQPHNKIRNGLNLNTNSNATVIPGK